MSTGDWIVGVKRSDGSYDTLTQNGNLSPTEIDEIIFPLSLPWEDEPVLCGRVLEKVASNERKMGAEITHSARVEGTVPNSDQIWHVELDIWEYPSGAYNDSEFRRTDQVRNAQWNPEDLIDAIRRQF